MQRRHAIIAAIALVALVLIPAAALAVGFHGGFGDRGTGPGPKNSSQADGAWAGNATHPNWTPGNCTGAGDHAGNASCIGDRNHAHQRGNDCLRNITGTQDQDRTRLRDRSSAVNRTNESGANQTLGPQGRPGRGIGR